MEIAKKLYDTDVPVQAGKLDVSLSQADIKSMKVRYENIRKLSNELMKKDVHFGDFGIGKSCLFKAGAEMLRVAFALQRKIEIEKTILSDGHIEILAKVNLYTANGIYAGSGFGSCTTMESKFRFSAANLEDTGKPVPREYWDLRGTDAKKAQAILGGSKYKAFKNDETGSWTIHKKGEKKETETPEDYYNTILKMAVKRADVDAVISTLGISEFFTQDMEDFYNDMVDTAPVQPPVQNPIQTTRQAPAQNNRPAKTQATTSPDKPEIDVYKDKLVKLAKESLYLDLDQKEYVNTEYKSNDIQRIKEAVEYLEIMKMIYKYLKSAHDMLDKINEIELTLSDEENLRDLSLAVDEIGVSFAECESLKHATDIYKPVQNAYDSVKKFHANLVG